MMSKNETRQAVQMACGGARRTTIDVAGQYREIVTDIDSIDPAGVIGSFDEMADAAASWRVALSGALDAAHDLAVDVASGRVPADQAEAIDWPDSDFSESALVSLAADINAARLDGR